MRRVLTAVVSRPDKVIVTWLVLALALMLPVSSAGLSAQTDEVQRGGHRAASQSQQQGEEDHPSPSSEEPAGQLVDLTEDDETIHDDHFLVLVGLKHKLPALKKLAPDSLHTSEFERPPSSLS